MLHYVNFSSNIIPQSHILFCLDETGSYFQMKKHVVSFFTNSQEKQLRNEWYKIKTRALHAVSTLICYGPSFFIKSLVKIGHNSRNIAFIVIPLVLQLHLVMLSKYSKFGFDTFNTFWVMGYMKLFLYDNDDKDDLVIKIAWSFRWNRPAAVKKNKIF